MYIFKKIVKISTIKFDNSRYNSIALSNFIELNLSNRKNLPIYLNYEQIEPFFSDFRL